MQSRVERDRAGLAMSVMLLLLFLNFLQSCGDLASRDRASMLRPRRKFSEGVTNQQGALCFFQDAETCEQ